MPPPLPLDDEDDAPAPVVELLQPAATINQTLATISPPALRIMSGASRMSVLASMVICWRKDPRDNFCPWMSVDERGSRRAMTKATIIIAGALVAGAIVACSSSTESSSGSSSADAGTTTPNETTDSGTTTTDSGTTPTTDSGTDSGTPTAKSTGTGTYDSNLTDYSITVRDVWARLSKAKAKGGAFESELKLDFSDTVGRCANEKAGVRKKNEKYLDVEVTRRAATLAEAEMVPGTYTFGPADGESYLGRAARDSTCKSSYASLPFTYPEATIKNIIVTSITATHVAGTYEIRATDGRYLKGTFDADFCESGSPTTSTCE